jgi:hypothetical protein
VDPLLAGRRRHRSRQGRVDHRRAAAADGGQHEGRQHGGFCVGEPWNEQLVNQGIGYTACTTGDLWKKHPEKSLGLRADWVDKNPKAAKAAAAWRSMEAQWCDKPRTAKELCEIVGKRQWFNCRPADIIGRIEGNQLRRRPQGRESRPVDEVLARPRLLSVPKPRRCGSSPRTALGHDEPPTSTPRLIIAKVNREDLWREAAKAIGVAAPTSRTRTSRGKETFFDGKVFDPADPKAYLEALQIKRGDESAGCRKGAQSASVATDIVQMFRSEDRDVGRPVTPLMFRPRRAAERCARSWGQWRSTSRASCCRRSS